MRHVEDRGAGSTRCDARGIGDGLTEADADGGIGQVPGVVTLPGAWTVLVVPSSALTVPIPMPPFGRTTVTMAMDSCMLGVPPGVAWLGASMCLPWVEFSCHFVPSAVAQTVTVTFDGRRGRARLRAVPGEGYIVFAGR